MDSKATNHSNRNKELERAEEEAETRQLNRIESRLTQIEKRLDRASQTVGELMRENHKLEAELKALKI